MNDLKNIVFTDEVKIKELQREFEEQNVKISKKIYSSVSEERLRVIKIAKKAKIKAPIENVFQEMVSLSAQNMHPNLKKEDLKESVFYRSSGKSNKIPFQVSKLKANEVLEIRWYANEQQFIKTISFYSNKNNTKTTIRYQDITTGMVSILGYFEKRIRSVYVKRQVIAFNISLLKTKLNLDLIKDNKKLKIERKIENMMKYSKDIY
ncbi:hypothetical protein [Mesoplasma florum]|uniref:hypothetical protein n=1 Tax=Mesoplasma florum TaxID=2151 RepID=UPI000D09200D|nr:hypothetical protein [Mesoplasma florum]AVN61298.1 hypothetical protein CG005_03360 [Mesoplasma florum]